MSAKMKEAPTVQVALTDVPVTRGVARAGRDLLQRGRLV